ncbi:hypothetical protein AGLY_002334 [Aphis glycines]|uniref:Uncharacterized protein n=1 Tax=Aphis glycines TaxID=307491 RepID=A0A6G0U380_APHGL|nr:hypothetical protein AGLY_002334 [Aphis glycines]
MYFFFRKRLNLTLYSTQPFFEVFCQNCYFYYNIEVTVLMQPASLGVSEYKFHILATTYFPMVDDIVRKRLFNTYNKERTRIVYQVRYSVIPKFRLPNKIFNVRDTIHKLVAIVIVTSIPNMEKVETFSQQPPLPTTAVNNASCGKIKNCILLIAIYDALFNKSRGHLHLRQRRGLSGIVQEENLDMSGFECVLYQKHNNTISRYYGKVNKVISEGEPLQRTQRQNYVKNKKGSQHYDRQIPSINRMKIDFLPLDSPTLLSAYNAYIHSMLQIRWIFN